MVHGGIINSFVLQFPDINQSVWWILLYTTIINNCGYFKPRRAEWFHVALGSPFSSLLIVLESFMYVFLNSELDGAMDERELLLFHWGTIRRHHISSHVKIMLRNRYQLIMLLSCFTYIKIIFWGSTRIKIPIHCCIVYFQE